MKKGYIYILVTALLFSTIELVGKQIANQVSPYQLTFLRFFIGGLVLLPFALRDVKKRGLQLTKNDWLYFLLSGILCIAIGMCIYQLAIKYTKASTVAIVFSTNPMFTIPFAALILKERIHASTLIALLFSMLGVLVILNPFHIAQGHDYNGILLAALSAVVFSLYSVLGKLRVQRYGSYIANSFTFLSGSLVLLLGILLTHTPVIKGIDSGNILQILYLSVVTTGLGYVFYFLAMKETSAITASTIFFIKPALAPLLALLLIHEHIPFNSLLGIAFILTGSYLSIRSKRASSAE